MSFKVFHPLVSSIRWAKFIGRGSKFSNGLKQPNGYPFRFLSVGFINPLGKIYFLFMKSNF